MPTDPKLLVSIAIGFLAVALALGIAIQCSAQVRDDAMAALREATTISCWAEAIALLLALLAIAGYAVAMGAV